MKTYVKSHCLLGVFLLALSAGTLRAQLTTINCGAVSTNASTKLLFANGTNFTLGSGFVQPILYQRVTNRFGTNNYFSTTNLLFQSLSIKTNPATSAALGAHLACQVISVSGPPGGVLSFWEQGAGWPTYDFPVGGIYTSGKNRFLLSNCENGAGRPDGDPFGNVRGRRFTVNKPGDYFVTFKLYDISKNHPTLAATPVHAPSDPLTIKFTTSVDLGITQILLTNNVATLTFKQGQMTNLFVEASTNLDSPNWKVVSGPFATAPSLTTISVTNLPATKSVYYRLRGVLP